MEATRKQIGIVVGGFLGAAIILFVYYGPFGRSGLTPAPLTQEQTVKYCADAYFRNHLGGGMSTASFFGDGISFVDKGGGTYQIEGTLGWTFVVGEGDNIRTSNWQGPASVTIKIEGKQFSASNAKAPAEFEQLRGPLKPATLPVPQL